jgi:hypothetical protein
MRKTTEIYTKGFDFHKDFMTLQVEKNVECKEPQYVIKQMELQMWQSKDRLVEWLKLVTEAIEKMPCILLVLLMFSAPSYAASGNIDAFVSNVATITQDADGIIAVIDDGEMYRVEEMVGDTYIVSY